MVYDYSFKSNLKMFFKPNIAMGNPDKYRLMKFISNTGLHSFGYNLSETDYHIIKTFILEKRDTKE